jgi:hypothetical protein
MQRRGTSRADCDTIAALFDIVNAVISDGRTRNLDPAFTEQRIAIASRRDKGFSDHELELF